MEDAFSVPFILSWLKSYVARFITHIQIVLQPICCTTGYNVYVKTSNIAFLLVLLSKILFTLGILYVILENSIQTRKIN